MQRRSYQTIRDRLFSRLHQASGKKVAYHNFLKTHLGDKDQAVDAFLDVLNNTPEFKADGLGLVPGRLTKNSSVEDLMILILKDYTSRGWEVYYE